MCCLITAATYWAKMEVLFYYQTLYAYHKAVEVMKENPNRPQTKTGTDHAAIVNLK
jgi:hypothetical protein